MPIFLFLTEAVRLFLITTLPLPTGVDVAAGLLSSSAMKNVVLPFELIVSLPTS